jgi:hypothetical protein
MTYLVYCIQIWSCTAISNLNELIKKQKNAIRLITSSAYNAHTEPLFKKLNILPVHQLCSFFKLQFMFQFKNNLLPPALSNLWQTNAERFQDLEVNIQLRREDDFYIPFARISQVERLPLTSFPRLWNQLEEDDIKSSASKSVFNSKLKKFYIDKLRSDFICNRLLCPFCHINL